MASTPREPETFPPSLSREVEALQVAELFRNLRIASVSAYFGTLLCIAVFLGDGLRGPHIAWLAYATVVAAVRLGLCWAHGNYAALGRDLEPWQWARLAVLGNFLAGIQWGLLGTWLFPEVPGFRQTFVIMVITCFVGGSITAHACVRWAHPALSVPAAVPSAIYIFFVESGPHYMAGFTALFFIGMVLYYSLRETELITRRIRADARLRRHVDALEAAAGADPGARGAEPGPRPAAS